MELMTFAADMPLPATPRQIDLEPVHNCNLRCLSCHVPQDELTKTAIPLSSVARLGENPGTVVKVGSTYEATTHPEFPGLINMLDALGMEVWLTTNGTLLTSRLIGAIDNPGVFRKITFSFDGATPELFERLRKGAKFEPTLERIKAFMATLDRSKTEVAVNYTMVRDNLCDLERAVDLWEAMGVDSLGLTPSNHRDENQFLTDQTYAVNRPLFDQAMLRVRTYWEGLKPRLRLDLPPLAKAAPTPEVQTAPALSCDSPFNEVRVRWDSKVVLCFNKFIIGDLRQNSLAEIWEGACATHTRKALLVPNEFCPTCGYFHYCRSARTDLDFQPNL